MDESRNGAFESVRGRIVMIVLLGMVGAVTRVVPFIAIVELARTLWPARVNAVGWRLTRAWGRVRT